MDPLRKRARALRNDMTDAERTLCKVLRGRQLQGFRFRRQVPIAGSIADFLCPQARLIVEVDGGQHQAQEAYDAERTAVLVGLGYRVLRYWNDDVLLRTESVIDDIFRVLTKGFTPPQPVRPAGIAVGRSSAHEPVARKRASSPPSLCEREGAEATAEATAEAEEEIAGVDSVAGRQSPEASGSSPSLSPKAKGRAGEGCS